MKGKITQDQLAMIIADMEHGEITTCEGCECDNCPLNKELPISLVGFKRVTICNALVYMSTMLNEVEYE